MRQGEIWVNKNLAGILTEDEEGYRFSYSSEYLQMKNAIPVSLTLPLKAETFLSEFLFPFFDGLDSRRMALGYCTKELEVESA